MSNTVGSWEKRPQAATAIPNLVLAADYVQAGFPVSTTEAANEAARRAVNALLQRSGSKAAPARVYPMYRPPEWDALKRIDADNYRRGRPNALDTPGRGQLSSGELDSLPSPFGVSRHEPGRR